MKVNEIANLGNNVKTMIKNEGCTVLMMNDATGEGIMTVYQVMPGVMICFSDMHMEKCDSEFELQKDKKVLCIDHCREVPGKYKVPARETMTIVTQLPDDYAESTLAIRSSLQSIVFSACGV